MARRQPNRAPGRQREQLTPVVSPAVFLARQCGRQCGSLARQCGSAARHAPPSAAWTDRYRIASAVGLIEGSAGQPDCVCASVRAGDGGSRLRAAPTAVLMAPPHLVTTAVSSGTFLPSRLRRGMPDGMMTQRRPAELPRTSGLPGQPELPDTGSRGCLLPAGTPHRCQALHHATGESRIAQLLCVLAWVRAQRCALPVKEKITR